MSGFVRRFWQGLPKVQVLVVEDDTLSRLITEAAVAKLGHSVLIASDGEAAWPLVQEHQFDAMASDRRCVSWTARTVLARQGAPKRHLPIFKFLTSHSDTNDF